MDRLQQLAGMGGMGGPGAATGEGAQSWPRRLSAAPSDDFARSCYGDGLGRERPYLFPRTAKGASYRLS